MEVEEIKEGEEVEESIAKNGCGTVLRVLGAGRAPGCCTGLDC